MLRSRSQQGRCPRGRRRRSPARSAAECPSSRNQPGVVAFSQSEGQPRDLRRTIGPSLMPTMPLDQPPPSRRRVEETDADRTPGTAAAASRTRSTRALRSSGGPPLAWRFNSTTSSGSGTKPSGNWLSDANVRRNSPDATTRTSDTAIWATTSGPRTANAAVARHPAARVLQRPIRGDAPQPDHRGHASGDRRETRESRREREHAPVGCEVQRHGALPRAQLLHEQRTAPLRERQPERRTGHGHDQTLDERAAARSASVSSPVPGAR